MSGVRKEPAADAEITRPRAARVTPAAGPHQGTPSISADTPTTARTAERELEAWLDTVAGLLRGEAGRDRTRIREELAGHVRDRVTDLMVIGLSEPEAVRAAVQEFGDAAQLARSLRRAKQGFLRRYAMHTALFSIAGAALGLSVVAVNNPGVLSQSPPEFARIYEPTRSSGTAEMPEDRQTLAMYDLGGITSLSGTPSGTRSGTPIGIGVAGQVVNAIDSITAEDAEPPTMSVIGSKLIVRAMPETHRRIVWIISDLRGPAVSQPITEPAELRVLQLEHADPESVQRTLDMAFTSHSGPTELRGSRYAVIHDVATGSLILNAPPSIADRMETLAVQLDEIAKQQGTEAEARQSHAAKQASDARRASLTTRLKAVRSAAVEATDPGDLARLENEIVMLEAAIAQLAEAAVLRDPGVPIRAGVPSGLPTQR